MKKQTTVTMDEVLGEIERLNNEKPEGFTVREMAKTTGMSRHWCRNKISHLVENGTAIFNGYGKYQAIDGRKVQIPVYKLVKNWK